MSQIIDDLRPILAALRKHQFWLVLALIPCVLIPTLLTAQAGLDGQIKANRSQIKSRMNDLQAVRQKPAHPNAQWKATLDAETAKILDETRGEWRSFWDSQASLRIWPEELGGPFVQQVNNLRPGGTLNVDSRTRYQTDVRLLVRQLPARMGAEDRMVDQAAAGAETAAAPARGNAPFRLLWRPENQKQVYGWFDWKEMPQDGRAATVQIVQAQEELWVYGLLCDSIKRTNKSAKTRFEAAIVSVEELAIGWPAAEEAPGGQGTGERLLSPQGSVAFGGPGPGQPQTFPKSAHPRFAGAGGRPGGTTAPGFSGMPSPDVQPVAADAAYRDCIYVDFNGKPLTAAELAAGPRMVNLMPFTLRVVMDERRIESLLADLARQPIPIDVRQLRINPGDRSVTVGAQPAGPQKAATDDRKYDVTVELRGTVGLATPPAEDQAAAPQPAGPPGAAAGPRTDGREDPAPVSSIVRARS
jgi:hypothetical protein